jgi:hypothetical protein
MYIHNCAVILGVRCEQLIFSFVLWTCGRPDLHLHGRHGLDSVDLDPTSSQMQPRQHRLTPHLGEGVSCYGI